MKADDYLIETCLNLKEGQSCECKLQGYTMHRYHDYWTAMYSNPTQNHLGRDLHTEDQLRKFMEGDPFQGSSIPVDMRECRI